MILNYVATMNTFKADKKSNSEKKLSNLNGVNAE